MKRAALYARFSTDLQNERSVEDQFALCRTYAARERLDIVATFEDRARSGSSILGRDGLLALMDDARAKRFDVVVVEALDRLSRDMEDLAGIHKRLTFAGIELRAVHDGKADTVLVGLRGLVGQLFREDGAKKVRRGMTGVVRDGRVAGGLCYGYRAVPGERGVRAIHDDEAGVIRRVFRDYASGRVPREIAADLNREGVPPPRSGRLWNASTINGNAVRGHGLLFNELYVGRIVWNRVRMVRNPDTGRRISRANAAEERVVTDVPHLRIVDDALWSEVQARKAERSKAQPHMVRRNPHLLSGLLKCGTCGSGMSVHDRDRAGKVRIRCSAVRESGSCDNRRILTLALVEEAVITGMRRQLADPRLIEIFVRRYNEERRRLAGDSGRRRAKLEARVAAAEREFERAFQAYVKGFLSETEAEARLPALRAEKEAAALELAGIEATPEVVTLHPAALAHYLREVEALAARLNELHQEGETGPSEALRSLIHSVTVYPRPPRQGVEVAVRGKLAALVGDAFDPLCGVSVVAEEGLEPPTQGL